MEMTNFTVVRAVLRNNLLISQSHWSLLLLSNKSEIRLCLPDHFSQGGAHRLVTRLARGTYAPITWQAEKTQLIYLIKTKEV